MTSGTSLKGVILAAGFGKRMARLTQNYPKPLLPIVNIPALERIILSYRDVGITDVLIVTGYKAEAIESYCHDGRQWEMNISYIRQTEVSGTGSAARLAAEFTRDTPFMLTYGDILLEHKEYQAVFNLFNSSDHGAVSALNRLEDISIGSAVYLDGQRIIRVVEKPQRETAGTNLNNAGLFIFTPDLFDAIDRTPKSKRGEYELTEAIQLSLSENKNMSAHIIDGVQYDIGTPEAYLESNISLIHLFSESTDSPDIISDNFASPNLVLTQPVALSDQAECERCRLGPGVCIGDGVRIGHSTSIDHSVILPGADIGDGVNLSYTIIGPEVNIDNRQILQGKKNKVIVITN